MYIKFLSFLIVSASSLRISMRLQDSHETDFAVDSLAGAFSGGGCFSSISQLGFLRGLLGFEFGNDGLKFSVIGSSSGGSWGLGMVFSAVYQSNYEQVHESALLPVITDHGVTNETYYQNEIGRWCMYKNLNLGVSRSNWAANLQACGKCAFEPEGCLDEGLFGVAKSCITSYQKQRVMAQRNLKVKDVDPLPYVELSGAGRKAFMSQLMEDQYLQFFEPQGIRRDLKLRELARVFQDKKDSWRRGVQWNIFWSRFEGIAPPVIMSGVLPGGSGSAAESDMSLLQAVAQSSDAVGAMLVATLVSVEMYSSCAFWIGVVQAQTQAGFLPFPYSKPLTLGLKLQDFHQVQYLETSPSLIKLPSSILRNAMSNSSNLVKFLMTLTHQERRDTLLSFIKSKDNSASFLRWDSDGMLNDNNGIGSTLKIMDDLPAYKRPKILISLITGMTMSNEYLEDETILDLTAYFKPTVAFSRLKNGAQETPLQKFCALKDVNVNNPNYFFNFEPSEQSGYDAECNKEIMLSPTADEGCWNWMKQSELRGMVFVESATVVVNAYWGIMGGYKISLMMSLLNKNDASVQWVHDVYGNHEARKRLINFPFPEKAMGQLMGLDDTQGFALMNYNAFKGYLSMCTVEYFVSKGKRVCSYCKSHPEECKKYINMNLVEKALKKT